MADINSAPDTASKANRRPRGRSPAYPAVSLPKAVARAEQLWTSDKQYPTPVISLVRGWGYANVNGPAGLIVSAMRKFGLVTDEGSKEDRRVRLTDLAVKIINHPDAESRQYAIRSAALQPPIHREMWDEFGADLPSDANLMWTLTTDRNFTETGAREFLKEYRETLDYAQLEAEPYTSVYAVDEQPASAPNQAIDTPAVRPAAPSEPMAAPSSLIASIFRPELPGPSPQEEPIARAIQPSQARLTTSSSTQQVRLPLPGGGEVAIDGPFPVTEAQWAFVMTVLGAMKPGLVTPEE